MKLPIPNAQVVLLIVPIGVFTCSLWLYGDAFIDAPGYSRESKVVAVIALIGTSGLLLSMCVGLWHLVVQGFGFRLSGERFVCAAEMDSGDMLVLGPLFGLAGKALLVNLDCEPAPARNSTKAHFRGKSPPVPEVQFEMRLCGRDGSADVEIAGIQVTRTSKNTWSSNGITQVANSGCRVVLGVDKEFPEYSLKIRTDVYGKAADSTTQGANTEGRTAPRIAIRTALAIGVRLGRWSDYHHASVRSATKSAVSGGEHSYR